MISSLKTNCKIKTYIQRLNCVRIGQCLLLGQCCAACSSAKTNERSKESRKRKSDGEIHIFHNERYFSEDDWKKKSEIINKKLKASKTREARLAEKFQDQLIDLESDDHNDLAWIMDNENNNIPEDMKTLWHQQIEITQTASKNGYRWHPKIIKLCLELYCKNPHVLEPLRNVMHLPSNRSIRYYKNKCEQQSGWNKNIVEWCLKDARERNLRECDYWGGFVIDEMKIEVMIILL
ncbi:uncharacterized protein LOC116292160 [Actinia tenebrosa]|uniref:Uncharacterized protein LOC116292160 n=1 Tax=Actinia tenebrosa TaxID=6105 RepID=A0A6P8HK64_ACTTE|nr:uncharacterized protein LOC116292160 [Actinia tenebrosa]